MKRVFAVLLAAILLLGLTACGTKSKRVSDTILSFSEDDEIVVHLEEKLSFFKKIDGHSWNMQGGDTDGKYGYYAINDGGDVGESITRIYKIDFSTWEIVMISEDLFCGHANDITYVRDTNQLIVTWCEEPAENATVVDAETLTIVEERSFPYKHPLMDYCAERKAYVFELASDNTEIVICNDNMEQLATAVQDFQFAQQCLECDEKLIYNLQSPLHTAGKGYMFVFNWDGHLVRLIQYDMPYESENICIYGDKLILAVNDHHEEKTIRFYEMSFAKAK